METKPHLPMPLTGARRIENERLAYLKAQRPPTRRFRIILGASDARATRPLACVLELISSDPAGADLTVTEHLVFVVVLDTAIGRPGRSGSSRPT